MQFYDRSLSRNLYVIILRAFLMKSYVAIVEKEKCHPSKCAHECMRYDPLNRKVPDSGFHLGPITGKAEIAEEVVMQFHSICAKMCPFSAIKIVKLPESLEDEPLQQFGKNAFRLFKVPVLKYGEVVGILGRNGIGKSTALSILAGMLVPNMGAYQTPADPVKVIQRFSTSFLGDYFRKLYQKKIIVAYKPQRIELLPQQHHGTVRELLSRVDERHTASAFAQELVVEHLLDRNLGELSGGELQKVALIATMAKKADVYYFDEPASFLDITSRIKAAKLIRSLKDDHVAVVVVEHDLATLDYVSDEIQIVYGEQAAYGIFSQSKGVRRGINEYLDGFLPEDNVRFRPYSILFQRAPPRRSGDRIPLLTFPLLEKRFEDFCLRVHAGALQQGEVLTAMGANGLGKTTFLKLLAGLLRPDVGSLAPVSVAYKMQYPEPFDGIVLEHLQKVAGTQFSSGWFQQNIMEKLNLQAVQHSDIRSLSGGELQKLYIACTLASDAQVIAMDEPSAFIDVEDRLHVAEVIKTFTETKGVATIVVDHDVQFVDYLSDAMLVFEGTPGKEGHVYGPCGKEEGMNRVLKMLDITYRKDKVTNRARINKPGSQLDQEQKQSGKYYYS